MSQNLRKLTFILILGAILLNACAPQAAAGQPPVQQNNPQPAAANNSPSSLASSGQINGAGSTFAQPIYSAWTYTYQSVDPSVTINYQGIGSGGGKKGIIDRTLDFAGTDALITPDEYASGKDLQMLPTLAGAVVLAYNISFNGGNKPSTSLILDRNTLVGIYNATINKWNDPAIVALNPDLKDLLPDAQITAVHRSDGSGTTELFTKSLASFSSDWKAGAGQSIEWPVDKAGNGLGGKGNPGVAAAVQNTPNSLGYVELDYAIANKMPFARMVNKAGNVVEANADSLKSAMADFSDKFTDQLTNTIVDAPGAGSWPIAGYTYLIIHMNSMTDCTKAQQLLAYIRWTLTDPAPAKLASDMGYAVLPASVQKTVLDKLGQVTCNGSSVSQ